MRRRMIAGFVGAAALAGVCGIGGTAAYFIDFDQAGNRVAVGRNTTEIREDFPDPEEPEEGDTPEYQKTVWIANNSPSEKGFNVSCFVRASISYSNYDIGKAVTLLGLDTTNWNYNSEDGYYYYRKILKEGESTSPLFTGVRIDRKRIDTLYQDKIHDLQINVYEESVSAGEFTDYQSAWKYYLNPEAAL